MRRAFMRLRAARLLRTQTPWFFRGRGFLNVSASRPSSVRSATGRCPWTILFAPAAGCAGAGGGARVGSVQVRGVHVLRMCVAAAGIGRCRVLRDWRLMVAEHFTSGIWRGGGGFAIVERPTNEFRWHRTLEGFRLHYGFILPSAQTAYSRSRIHTTCVAAATFASAHGSARAARNTVRR
jgi:hypothetical protein